MSRELKFRAWDLVDKDYWSGVHLISDSKEVMIFPMGFKKSEHPIVWQQYIGLEDEKGSPIYEGDIVMTGQFTQPAAVVWTDFLAQWSLEVRVYDGKDPDDYWLNSECIDPDMSIRVVGNIYENEDLLNGR